MDWILRYIKKYLFLRDTEKTVENGYTRETEDRMTEKIWKVADQR